jgi:YjjG family noncanonical pyrimidine nucleotidase
MNQATSARYRAILFDMDGTLIDFDACVRDALRAAFAELGFAVDDAQMWAEIQEASAEAGAIHWDQREQKGWTRAQVMEAVMRDTLVALDAEAERAAEPAHRYWSRFCQTSHLNPGARETLERLQGHFKLALITNGDTDAQRGRLQATGLEPFFDAVIISDEVGCAKPDARIFALALDELGVGAKETLFVGDSVSHDYVGAQNAGIDFCYYQPDVDAHPEVQPKLRVCRLEEAADWLFAGEG